MLPIVHIDDVTLKEKGNGKMFAAKLGRVSSQFSLNELGCTVTVLPPGKRAFPFHRHHAIDELFYIVSGTGEYRVGDKTFPLKAGDIIGAPAGGEAHQIVNSGNTELCFLAISSMSSADVVEYPDTGKIGIMAGMKEGNYKTATYRGLGRIAPADYWDGEGA